MKGKESFLMIINEALFASIKILSAIIQTNL